MSEILQNADICTQITTVKLAPGNQEEVVNLMIERAHYMARQKGFVSANLHRSKDGSHIINYVQWTSPEGLAAAHHSPEFRSNWPRFGEIVKEVEPCLYDVVYVETA
jgi:heme-degrading monooxygenase HmoA